MSTHLLPGGQATQHTMLFPVGEDPALVLIGGEEADHPSRDHLAQIEECAARLMHLQATRGCLRAVPTALAAVASPVAR